MNRSTEQPLDLGAISTHVSSHISTGTPVFPYVQKAWEGEQLEASTFPTPPREGVRNEGILFSLSYPHPS